MATTVVMPKMGYDMTEGKIVRWLKHEGDEVSRGEPVATIETEKVNIDIEAYASGVLRRIVAQEGQMVPVGEPIAVIGAPDEEIGEVPPPKAAEAGAPPTPAEEAAPAWETAARAEERIKATPIARRLAEEHSIDLSRVQGTGPDGRITREDVEAFIQQRDKAPAAAPTPSAVAPAPAVPGEEVELSRMRQAIARHMADSKRTIPHFYVTTTIDMSEALRLRRSLNAMLPEESRISINDLIIKAAAKALQKFPEFNATLENGRVRYHKEVNIGVAIALDEGLIAPAISNCVSKSLPEIAAASRDLAARARDGRLRPDEYSAVTFTVSNLGMYDVDNFIAIINPPQSAVLAVGSVMPQAVVRDNQIAVADVMKMTVSADHRVTDGARAAQFLQEIKRHLQNPVSLLV